MQTYFIDHAFKINQTYAVVSQNKATLENANVSRIFTYH